MSKALCDNLSTIVVEMRSHRAPVRNKSLERLQTIFDNRSDDLVRLLATDAIQQSSSSSSQSMVVDTTWSRLFDSAHEACVQQVTLLETKQAAAGIHLIENKNRLHVGVLQKIVEMANNRCDDDDGLSNADILERCFQCFGGSRLMRKYFGMCYMQILHLYILPRRQPSGTATSTTTTTVVVTDQWDNPNLQDLKLNEWSRKYTYIFLFCTNVSTQFFQQDFYRIVSICTMRNRIKCLRFYSALHRLCSMDAVTIIWPPICRNIFHDSKRWPTANWNLSLLPNLSI